MANRAPAVPTPAQAPPPTTTPTTATTATTSSQWPPKPTAGVNPNISNLGPRPQPPPPLPPASFYGANQPRYSSPAFQLALPPATQSHFQAYVPPNQVQTPTSATPSGAVGALTQQARAIPAGTRKGQSLKGIFTRELRALMFAFGDDGNPAPDSVNVVEEIVIEFIQQLCGSAVRGQAKPKLTADALKYALDRPADAAKLGRLHDLIYHQKTLAEARSMFKV